MYDRIVLNIPHSSSTFPFGKEGWDKGIDAEILRWTDWYTDWLFQSTDSRVISVTYPFSRFFCDVERLEDDPLESVGQGIVYRRFNGLKRSLSRQDEIWAIHSYYEHLSRLRSQINESKVLLLDCHSFPSDLSDVEVCIGFNNDWSCPSEELIGITIDAFESAGYNVGVNCPYSNAIAPQSPYTYKSMMIELNKSTYLDGLSRLCLFRAEKVKGIIDRLYQHLLYQND